MRACERPRESPRTARSTGKIETFLKKKKYVYKTKKTRISRRHNCRKTNVDGPK